MVRIKLKDLKGKTEGFTLVELLIVIVVIAILAAITIIAYNGVTQKAKTSQAQSAANSVQQVAELYNTDKSGYPTQKCQFSDTSLTTKLPASITLDAGTSTAAVASGSATTGTVVTSVTDTGSGIGSTAPTSPSTIGYMLTTSDGTNNVANVNGGVVFYWDYTDATAPHVKYVYVGGATATSKTYGFATDAC